MALGLDYTRAIERGRRHPGGAAAARTRRRSSRCSTASTGICLSGGPGPRPGRLRRRDPSRGGADRARPRPLRAGRWPAPRWRGTADAGDLPRRPDPECLPRRNAVQHLPELCLPIEHRQPSRTARSRHAVEIDAEQPAGPDAPADGDARRQLLPPPGDRPPRRRPARLGPGARRGGRGDRGAGPRLRARRPVARGVHRPPGPSRRRCSRRFVEAAARAARRRRGGRRSRDAPSRRRATGRRGDPTPPATPTRSESRRR